NLSPLPQQLDVDDMRDGYREVLRIRRFEEKAGQLYGLGEIVGPCHLCIGQEAVAVGLAKARSADDRVITAYRNHGHAIASGADLNGLMAELCGRASGLAHGKAGSANITWPADGFFGGHAIIGSNAPMATGLAWADRQTGRSSITWCVLGDRACDHAMVHEAMALAAQMLLPVVFIVEDNSGLVPSAGPSETGAGRTDGTAPDSGPLEAGSSDVGSIDAGSTDAGSTDAGSRGNITSTLLSDDGSVHDPRAEDASVADAPINDAVTETLSQSFGVACSVHDGMDFTAVVRAVAAARNRVLTTPKPETLVFRTQRFRGHSLAAPGRHAKVPARQQTVSDAANANTTPAPAITDPLIRLRHDLLLAGLPEDELRAIDQQVRDEVNAATRFAQADTEPSAEILISDLRERGRAGATAYRRVHGEPKEEGAR
ncbi:MAG: thiamine pyrophosphate-dependent enzyme, partial [Pseudomonadota bacterium]